MDMGKGRDIRHEGYLKETSLIGRERDHRIGKMEVEVPVEETTQVRERDQ